MRNLDLEFSEEFREKSDDIEGVEEREMKSVIEKMLKRKEPPEEQKASQGCSIKWK